MAPVPPFTVRIPATFNITSFGVDEYNELFFCGNQRIYKLTSNEGDLNNDNVLNVLDVILLVNMALNETDDDYNGDMNSDGGINVLDIVLLVNLILSN